MMLRKGVLVAKFIAYALRVYWQMIKQALSQRSRKRTAAAASSSSSSAADKAEAKNIVVIGASFGGYYAAKAIAALLPPGSPFRLVVIEPHSHFHFTWVLPRFCVVDQEKKAFIPYSPFLEACDPNQVRWIQDRVVQISRETVQLASTGGEIPYAFLVVATGSEANGTLPSRVGADTKEEGAAILREMQGRIQRSQKLVVVGGGAAGVELAADAKEKYPSKKVVLVHSRAAVMHRFGPELQAAASKALEELGVEVILGERTTSDEPTDGTVTLTSGRKIECDLLVNCAGQRPCSGLLAKLAPSTITPSGHVRVKPTLQVQDDSLTNVYAVGDVIDTDFFNPNSRAAFRQGTTAAHNIVAASMGKVPCEQYSPHWADGVIKLTLGLRNSVMHVGDGKAELLFRSKEKDLALMSAQAWTQLGAKPFEDGQVEKE